MNALELAMSGVWSSALSIASQGFLSGSVAADVSATTSGGGRAAYYIPDDDTLAELREQIEAEEQLIVQALMRAVLEFT